VAERTVRSHTEHLAREGLLERAPVFGGYRYQWHKKPRMESREYLAKIEDAEKVLSGPLAHTEAEAVARRGAEKGRLQA
jgi:hypothetical protein